MILRDAFLYQEGTLVEKEARFNKVLREKGNHLDSNYGYHVSEWSTCNGCRLSRIRIIPCIGTGSIYGQVMVIGEAPGPVEDTNGVIFSGPTGTLLRNTMSKVGFDLDYQVFFTNAVGCIPRDTPNGKFRTPTESELKHCTERIDDQMRYMSDLKAIILCGKTAYLSYMYNLNPDWPEHIRMADILGWGPEDNNIRDGVRHYITYHPSYVERQRTYSSHEEWKKIMQAWIYDLIAVKKYIDTGEIIEPRRK